MKISWGWKVTALYVGFAGMIIALVVASMRQDFDLVSQNYYEEEIKYQDVIDAGRNQSQLSAPMMIHASRDEVIIEFPDELRSEGVAGTVRFYSPVNASWDRSYKLDVRDGRMVVSRADLEKTRYVVKIRCAMGGDSYYQESEIQLHI